MNFWRIHTSTSRKKIVNFHSIYKSIRGEKVPESNLTKYQTVQNDKVKKFPQGDQNKFLSAAFRTDKKDLYFEKEVIKSHFLRCQRYLRLN